MLSRINPQPRDVCLYHVGGTGGYGPIETILRELPERCILVAVEARQDNGDQEQLLALQQAGIRSILVNACVGETTGRADFHVGQHPESSSLLYPAGQGEHMGAYLADNIDLWEEQSRVSHTIPVETKSLFDIVSHVGLTPEVLSLDAQGAELAIMKGLGPLLKLVNVVCSEVEFHEIYRGQALFHHQMEFLTGEGFRLVDIYNQQFWHPGPSVGQGLLTVGEALWFRSIESFLTIHQHDPNMVEQGVTLAAIALSYLRASYAYTLVKRLEELAGPDRVREAWYDLGLLPALVDFMDQHKPEYERDRKWYLQHLELKYGPGNQG